MIKLVTVLFADVVDSTAQSERMSPDDIRASMAELFEAMGEEIRSEGGTVERLVGDAIMADFGVPIAREDDPLRAVRAARRMLARLQKLNETKDPAEQLQMRIGINTGEVSAGGSLGDQLLVMGDAVNIAARLEQAAEPGTIVVGERTARALHRLFDLRVIEGLRVKGKTDELTAYVVTGEVAETPERSLPSPARMIGRSEEMKMLRAALERAQRDRIPCLVTVIGEPGVGKSRLVKEFLSTIRQEVATVSGRCVPPGHAITLAPLRDLLRTEVGFVVSDTASDVTAKVREYVSGALEDEANRQQVVRGLLFTLGIGLEETIEPREVNRQMVHAWRMLLSALASRRPLVVVVEDIHWADTSLLEMLGDLAEHVRGPVLFLCPARPDFLVSSSDWLAGLPDYSSLKLEPLGPEDAEQLIAEMLDIEELPEGFREQLLESSEGNPFFLEEMLGSLVDGGHLTKEADRWKASPSLARLDIPDNVQAVILSRLDLLRPQERQGLQLASVIGRSFWAGALHALVAGEDTDRITRSLDRRQLIVEQPTSSILGESEYAFKHALIRDVAYESLPRRTRGNAHAATAAWIERTVGERANEFAELLAHHYEIAYDCLARDDLRREARRCCLQAAHNELRRFAIAEAGSLGRRAVELSEGPIERVQALESLGDLYTLTNQGDAGWATYNEALAELKTIEPLDRASFGRLAAKAAILPARWPSSMERVDLAAEVRPVISAGLDAVGEADSRDRVLLLSARSLLQSSGFEPSDEVGDRSATEAVVIAERLDDPDLLSVAADALLSRAIGEARYGAATRVNERRLAVVDRMRDTREISDSYGTAAFTCAYIGRYRDAIRYATEAMELSRGTNPAEFAHGLIWRIQTRFMVGDWDGALEDQQMLEKLSQGAPSGFSIRGFGVTFFLWELRGDEEQAGRYESLVRAYVQQTYQDGLGQALGIPARALAHRGNVDEARSWLDLSTNVYLGGQLEAACEIVAAQEDWSEARDVLTRARSAATSGGLLALPLYADRLEGRAAAAGGDSERAEALLRTSAEGFSTLGAPWEEAWSKLLLGEVQVRMGRVKEAERALYAALFTFERLGSLRETKRAETLLREL